jgi:hypothetical protein
VATGVRLLAGPQPDCSTSTATAASCLPAVRSGPELLFLDPVLTREDIRSVANGRPATRIDKCGARGALGLRSGTATRTRSKNPSTLNCASATTAWSALALDASFSQVLGDRRIEMLARSFTSRITDLDLKRKEIRCVLPADSLKHVSPR